MTKQLVIDDEWRARWDRLVRHGVQPGSVRVRTSHQAIDHLHLDNFDRWSEIWFDFDLRMDDTTGPVAQLLAEYAFHGLVDKFPLCVVHTMNPVGRANLIAVFQRWDIPHREVFL